MGEAPTTGVPWVMGLAKAREEREHHRPGAIAATASEEEQRLMGEPNGEVGRGWGRSGGTWRGR
jgi:hypothetical protein